MVTQAEIATWLCSNIAEILEVDVATIDPDEEFETSGLSSADAVFMSGDLSEWLGLQLSPSLAVDHPTVNALSRFLAAVLAGDESLPDDSFDWDDLVDEGVPQ
jgi:acyl carrier protein